MPTISQVVIEGFRVYRNKLEPAPFSPRHNVVGVCKTSVPKESSADIFSSDKGSISALMCTQLVQMGRARATFSQPSSLFLANWARPLL